MRSFFSADSNQKLLAQRTKIQSNRRARVDWEPADVFGIMSSTIHARLWRRLGPKLVLILLLATMFVSGCRPSRLTRSNAAELIKQAGIVKGAQELYVLASEGCFSRGKQINYSNPRVLLEDLFTVTPGPPQQLRQSVLRAFDLGFWRSRTKKLTLMRRVRPHFVRSAGTESGAD
jgi:hypothetical protein